MTRGFEVFFNETLTNEMSDFVNISEFSFSFFFLLFIAGERGVEHKVRNFKSSRERFSIFDYLRFFNIFFLIGFCFVMAIN